MSDDGFVSLKGSGDINWNPTKEDSHPKEVVGVFKFTKENQGQDKTSSVHTMEGKKGDIVFWGSKVLDDQLSEVNPGDTAKIKYLGKKKSEKGGREYHDWEVLVKRAEQTATTTEQEAVAEDSDDDMPWD